MYEQITKLIKHLHNETKEQILVVGDFMLDEYYTGDVNRISPEAPVPVVRVERKEMRLGGAGLVSASLSALGAEVLAVGIVNNDEAGTKIKKLLSNFNVNTEGLIDDPNFITPVKQRIIGLAQHRIPQQLIRIDFEDVQAITQRTEKRIESYISSKIDSIKVVAIEDYNKSVFVDNNIIQFVIKLAKQRNIPTIIDPSRIANYSKYADADIITPNRLEAYLTTGIEIKSTDDAIKAGKVIREKFNIGAVVITIDKDGIVIVDKDSAKHIPTQPREVFDNTGAGDVVLATIALSIAEGLSLEESAILANIAGGWEVQQPGAIPISRNQLKFELTSHRREHRGKLIDRKHLQIELEILRNAGKKIVFTNGCFDLLHPGHISYLEFARRCGDILIVGMNSDKSVKEIKGPNRPLISELDRARMLASLEAVDYVVIFEEPSVINLIKEIKPDILVKGQDYTVEGVVGHEFVQSYGGKVILAPIEHQYSTTKIIENILQKYQPANQQ